MMTEFTTQARLLARHLKDTLGVELTHTQALEALAAQHNFKSWNVMKASAAQVAPKVSSGEDLNAVALLHKAMQAGLTVGQAITEFSNSRTPEELAYLNAARDRYTSEGDLEFDDNAVVSLSSDGGAYVMAWKWLYRSETALPDNVFSVLSQGFDAGTLTLSTLSGPVTLDEGNTDIEYVALDQVIEGDPVDDSTILVRIEPEHGPEVSLTVGQLRALSWDDQREVFCSPEGALPAMTLAFER